MPTFPQNSPAFGHPGIEPRWTQGNKDGVGTAYSTASRVWFTLWNGVLTECYYPTIDRPQLRDLQLLISDGETFFHEEKRHLSSRTERMFVDAPAYAMRNEDPEGRYAIEKQVIADPHLSCILQRVRLHAGEQWRDRLHVYALCAPHMEVSGLGNDARVVEVAGHLILAAHRCGTWMALACDAPFARASAGYVGASDGWTDMDDNKAMDWSFDHALDGNVALTGQIDLSQARETEDGAREWVMALAFGDNFHQAVTTLLQSLDQDFDEQRERFGRQWDRTCHKTLDLAPHSGDGGSLYRSSIDVLLSHEDKTFAGALIASLSIPWGEAKNAIEVDGYHLVWPRDMVNSATGLLAAGDAETPLRALIYLAASQQADGGFPQNFWVDARPHWPGVQLDEVSFPVLLAYYLKREGALKRFDPTHMVLRAARYLIERGPVTQQERWEENSGYSPSTLAVVVSALVVASEFAREGGDEATARWILEHADWIESKLEAWMTTDASTWSEERIYARIAPVDMSDHSPQVDWSSAEVLITNREPGSGDHFPARDIVDAGCLHLARFGVRPASDPVLASTTEAIDAALKVETPRGACWKRYPRDGYGQRDDGTPYEKWGVGRPWPLLSGERAHFELQRNGNWLDLRDAMEAFASSTGLLPEQVWDADDLPEKHMHRGDATGAARPLVWAHAEYVKLLRSARDGRPFDLIDEVAQRYASGERKADLWRGEVWKPRHQPREMAPASPLRLLHDCVFTLRWSDDEWESFQDTPSQPPVFDFHFCDIAPRDSAKTLRWTFFYPEEDRWEGRDYCVAVAPQL
jgi:glucoamylase